MEYSSIAHRWCVVRSCFWTFSIMIDISVCATCILASVFVCRIECGCKRLVELNTAWLWYFSFTMIYSYCSNELWKIDWSEDTLAIYTKLPDFFNLSKNYWRQNSFIRKVNKYILTRQPQSTACRLLELGYRSSCSIQMITFTNEGRERERVRKINKEKIDRRTC